MSQVAASRPSWSEGDHWVQRAYYEDSPNETLYTIEYFVKGLESLSRPEGAVAALRVDSVDTNRTVWLRSSDLALLRERNGDTTSDHDPACEAYPDSPDPGALWSHACLRLGAYVPGHVAGEGYSSIVEGSSVVDVPGGKLAAAEIHSTPRSEGPPPLVEFYSPAACFPARVVVAATRHIVLDLVVFECKAAAAT